MNEHMPEPLIYAAWVRALQDRLIRDELGPLARELRAGRTGLPRTRLPRR
jgi:penicillin G amidase